MKWLGPDTMILVFWMLSFKPAFSLSSFTLIKRPFSSSSLSAIQFSSVQFSRSVMSDSLRPHESQHARPPCKLPTPRVHPNSCALSRWCQGLYIINKWDLSQELRVWCDKKKFGVIQNLQEIPFLLQCLSRALYWKSLHDAHPNSRWMGHGGEVWQNVVHWRREWQTTSVFLPWKPHKQYEKAKW